MANPGLLEGIRSGLGIIGDELPKWWSGIDKEQITREDPTMKSVLDNNSSIRLSDHTPRLTERNEYTMKDVPGHVAQALIPQTPAEAALTVAFAPAKVLAPVARAIAPKTARIAAGGLGALTTSEDAEAGAPGVLKKIRQTVINPQRNAYPGIYGDPRELVAEAAARVAPENPLMRRLFGVGREDLWDISQQGARKGNLTEVPYQFAEKGKGAKIGEQLTGRANTQRINDLIEAAKERPELYRPMASWYTMDPLYQEMVRLHGKGNADAAYKKFNTLTGMSSPGSEVLTELNRGSAANWLSNEGRFDDFVKYAGIAEEKRGAGFPADMRGVQGHAYHKTAQAGPMANYLERGDISDMKSAKVPSYIHASGVPEVGFQTQFPVGDAHWSRIVGLPDVRGATSSKGMPTIPKASASVPEMRALTPWWQEKIAAAHGIEPVPAQAVVWGAGSGATGVTSPIGAGKLELLSQQIGKTAKRLNISPEEARDLVLMGKTHAGKATPGVLGATAGVSAGTAALLKRMREDDSGETIKGTK
jgi:hypothetical protein